MDVRHRIIPALKPADRPPPPSGCGVRWRWIDPDRRITLADRRETIADTQPIRLADTGRFTLGGVTVTPAARTLAAGTRESVIEPRVMQVLVTLHRRHGEVVGREALIDACWDGRTVGEDAINRAILKLRRALNDIGGDVTVETVARVGYRLRAGSEMTVGRRTRCGIAGLHVVGGSPPPRVPPRLAGRCFSPACMETPRQAPPPSRVVVVQPMRVAASDAPARRLAQDFASDLSRAVVGHDGRLEFADAGRATGPTPALTVTGSVASLGKDLHAVGIITRRDDPGILWSHDYTASLARADALRQQVGTNVAAVLVCALGTDGLPEQVADRTTALYLETCSLHAGDHRREAYLLQQVIARAPRFAGGWTNLAISLTFASADADDKDRAAMRR